jgi:hypothetical protein
MPIVHFGSKQQSGFELKESGDLIAVRTRSKRSLRRAAAPVDAPFADALDDSTLVAAFPDAGVEVYRVHAGPSVRSGKARSLSARKAALRQAPDVRFAGGVLVDAKTKDPVLYTENVFAKFVDHVDAEHCEAVLKAAFGGQGAAWLRHQCVFRRGAGRHRASGVRHRQCLIRAC